MKPATYRALVAVASALVENHSNDSPAAMFGQVEDWQELAEEAERHGLSVMLGRLAVDGKIEIPRVFDLQLKALTIRHQKIMAARHTVLTEIIDIFAKHQIQFAFLKGAALAELVYDPPWLRPMRDVDLLVSPQQALQAQRLLREMGFNNRDHGEGYLSEHHHLPNSTITRDGFNISVEVHHDALSGDVDASLTLLNLEDDLQPFQLAGRTVYAFGHSDMLRHLCYHTFEPAATIKLGSLVDIIRYATHFSDQIHWQRLKTDHANIVNALCCIDALITLPPVLRNKLAVDIVENWQPAGAGMGFMPLSRIARLEDKQAIFRALFWPSAWWTHIFYGVPPGRSLLLTRWLRHPATLAKWLHRRRRAAKKSNASE